MKLYRDASAFVASILGDATAAKIVECLDTADKERQNSGHIAIARRLNATLVSTDLQQVKAARALGAACINPLEEPA